ncbi:nucleotidyltransferase family protein, partial [Methylicorpusculum sp.]|uniref:nucleotidyltransferase family protein n=1 Tax=Methylicorpusculum sp. TaxID=2713644 RepID=UPI002ABC61C8
MSNWKDILLLPGVSIREAIFTLDKSALQIVLIVDEKQHLLGTITDGDIRRGILRGMSLDDSVKLIMNISPTVAQVDESREGVLALMRKKHLLHIPIVDESGCVVSLETLHELIQSRNRNNWVVLMAGGLGSRLHPLTEDCPKPMLNVGNKPLLETILENFIEYGFSKFYISVNYMADIVKSHFEDGKKWGIEIQYLEETQKLGTAGALSLLPRKPSEPIFVMNGDILTKVNFSQLLDFHANHIAQATMCVREYDYQVPYGVVTIDNHRVTQIEEKPIQRFFVNAGIYVIEPEMLGLIPSNTYFDMPNLFDQLITSNKETAAFPIREYWLD